MSNHQSKASALSKMMAKSRLRSGGCIEWSGRVNTKGYGQIMMSGQLKMVHRVSWEMANGRIPDGAIIMHSCDNPACINPMHLLAGSYSDNTRDSVKKGRWRQANNGAGGRTPTISPDLMEDIKLIRVHDLLTIPEISSATGIKEATLWYWNSRKFKYPQKYKRRSA